MALNSTTPSRLFHAKLGSSEADVTLVGAVSSVPAGERWVARCITVSNKSTTDRYVLLRIVPSGETPGDEHNILPGATTTLIKGGETAVFVGQWTLHAGDKIRASCSNANDVTVRGDGIIITGF